MDGMETREHQVTETPPKVESIWGPRLGRLTVGLLLTIVAGAFEALAVATVLPSTVDDLGGLDYYGWILASFTLANLIGIVVAGGEIDRRGLVPPFIVGVACFSGGLLIAGLAPSMPILIVGRIFQGFASGMLISIAYATVRYAYDADARPRLMALWSSAWVIPGLIGPAIAGFVAETVGWRWVFLGMIPFPIIAAILTLPPLRGIQTAAASGRDLRRLRDALLLAGGTALVLAGFNRSTWILLVAMVAVGAMIMIPSFRRLSPPGTLRARPGVAASVACLILLTIGFFGFEFFIPLALTDLRHQSSVVAGLPLTATSLTWTAGAWIVDRRSKVSSRTRMVRGGMALVALGVVLTFAVVATSIPVAVSFLTWAIAGLGMGTCFSTLMLSVLDDAPEGSEGATISAGQLGNTLGVSLGVGIGGAIIAATSVDEVATVRGMALLAVASVLVLAAGMAIASRSAAPRSPVTRERIEETLIEVPV